MGRFCYLQVEWKECRSWTLSSPDGKRTRKSLDCKIKTDRNQVKQALTDKFPQFFHHYLRIVTGENNSSSCLGCIMADVLPLWHNLACIFLGKIQPIYIIVKVKTQSKAIYNWMIQFFYSHCTVYWVLMAEWWVRATRLFVADVCSTELISSFFYKSLLWIITK